MCMAGNCPLERSLSSVMIWLLGFVPLVCVAQDMYPPTARITVVDTLHGMSIVDDYQWIEDGADSMVIRWTNIQEKLTRSSIDTISCRPWIVKRLNELWRYDDQSTPERVLRGDRLFFKTKKKDDERWVFVTKENDDAQVVELLNPNTWGPTETLDFATPSRDGTYVAFGKAKGGSEDARVRVMEVETGNILPDTLRGWRQGGISWLPDNCGFYYTAYPARGEVPAGEEQYWHSVYFHRLGTPGEEDQKIFWHDEVKEYFHWISLSEDGKYLLYYRSRFNKNEVYFRPLDGPGELIPIATGFDASYGVDLIENKLLITTDLNAPLWKVCITDVDRPGSEFWRELLPETGDKLSGISCVSGHIYAAYLHHAYTKIAVHDLDGKRLRDLPLPGLGTAHVWGYWSKPEVWISYSSFTYPRTVYRYRFKENALEFYHRLPVDVDVRGFTTELVWYESKDGTPVSMFLIHGKSLTQDGTTPVLLTGYGGFNAAMTPYFSTSRIMWLEAGGMVAVPHLRGGGEYGRAWHEAGKREHKQNVFDDFIAAAEWLVENNYTRPEHLAISGGSNGGLLVGAVAVQRPDLFRAVLCTMPLLDMLRYHKFGYANIWSEEYGSADDPEAFQYLRAYSPYHNIVDGVSYPAMLIIGSENDARVDPLHARKMAARLQAADPAGEPHLLLVRKASGHGGGTTLYERIEQSADGWAFLMSMLGMGSPIQPPMGG